MRIAYSKSASKSMMRLDTKLATRISLAIDMLPSGDVKVMTGHNSRYRLRVGTYRILYSIIDGTIVIDEILPRGSAYKNKR